MMMRPLKFNFSRRSFYLGVRVWKLRFCAALAHWASREFNPFLAFELRHYLRRKSGPLFFLWPLFFIGLALILTVQFSVAVSEFFVGLAAQQSFEADLMRRALDNNQIGWMAIVAAGLCGYAALIYSARAARVFLREHNSGTFNQLLLIPVAETRLALLTSAPAAAITMALWFLLLPLWLMALATNQWSAREFFGLPLLLLAIAICPPQWTPLDEEITFAHDAFDETEAPSAAPTQNDAQELKPEKEASEIDEEAQIPGDPRHAPLFQFDPVSTITLLVVWQIVMFFARSGGFKLPPTLLNYLLPLWRTFLPAEVWNLAPSILFSWPLFLIRSFTAPLPFFNGALPLGCWLVPRLLLSRVAAFSIFRLSFLGSRSLQFRRWGRHFRAAKRGQAYLFWFFASGFLWPWLIGKGTLAAVLPGAPLNTSWARAALWTLLLIITTWTISARLHRVFDTPLKKVDDFRHFKAAFWSCVRAWRQSKTILGGATALYFALCGMSGNSGVDAVWRARLPATLLVMSAYLVADFSGIVLKNALPKGLQSLWNSLRFLWFWGLLWETVFRLGWAHYTGLAFDLTDAPHILLSPFVTLLTLLNSDISLPLQGALWQLCVASLIFGAAALLVLQKQGAMRRKTTVIPAPPNASQPSFLAKFLRNLWRVIWFVPALVLRFLFWPVKTISTAIFPSLRRFFENLKPFLEGQTSELQRGADRFDNPILQRAFHIKWRHISMTKDLTENWLALVGFQILVFLVLLGLALLKPISLFFYGGNNEYNRQAALLLLHWRSWGDAVFGAAMVLGLIINLVALSSQTKVFDQDRKNGGMVFLFLTPLSEREIIGGYFGAALLPGAWYHSALYPAFLLAALLEIVAGKWAILPLLLWLMVLLHTLLICCSIASVWSAVRAKNAEGGNGWAFFCGLVPQGILMVTLLFIISSTQGFWPWAATAFAIMLGVLAAYIFWRDALRCLHRERFGDVSLRGTIAN